MDALYAKLYDKYNRFKKKKLSEVDEVNREQEEKFLRFVSAAEELIQNLKNENENLQAIVDNLRSELASIRSAKDKECAEYQKLLMEENQKNKALSEEVERLDEMVQEELPCNSKYGSNGSMQLNTPESVGVATTTTKKRNRQSEDEAEKRSISPHISDEDRAIPGCCTRTLHESGGGVKENGAASCAFQVLSEYLLGMKLSTTNQVETICVRALHESSGYSFSLTWINNSAVEEAELLYHVLSLGTFERMAPEWMRDVLMFSTSMCPVFFERVSRVIKLLS